MADRAPIYKVIIDAKGVRLEKVEPGRPGYDKARKNVILRQRDAIERFRNLKIAGKGFEGVHCFQFLDSAKTFALLRLQALEHDLEANLDRVQAFDAGAK